jgi:hypothetical protein
MPMELKLKLWMRPPGRSILQRSLRMNIHLKNLQSILRILLQRRENIPATGNS